MNAERTVIDTQSIDIIIKWLHAPAYVCVTCKRKMDHDETCHSIERGPRCQRCAMREPDKGGDPTENARDWNQRMEAVRRWHAENIPYGAKKRARKQKAIDAERMGFAWDE